MREFRITYVLNAINGRSLVQQIKDCDGAGVCLPATAFTWTQPVIGTPPTATNWGGPQASFTSIQIDGSESDQLKAQVLMGDFNGDGAMDLIRGTGNGSWQVCLSTGTTFNCQNWSGPAALSRDVLVGDFNGDGKSDLAFYPRVDGPGNWTMCLSTGTGFNCQNWPGYGAQTYYGKGQTLGGIAGDFNGDGRDDVAIASAQSGDERICRSVGNGFEGGTCQPYPGSYLFMYASKLQTEENHEFFQRGQMSGDIDGDGRTDVIYYAGHRSDPLVYPQGGWSGVRATDTGFVAFSAASNGQVMLDGATTPGDTRFADVTGDPYASLSDVVNGYITDGTNPARMEICRSTGLTLSCRALTVDPAIAGPVSVIRDLDGDGRPDVVVGGRICQLNLTAYGANNADQYALSCPAQPDWTPNNPAGLVQQYAADFNGDGLVDSAVYVKQSSTTGYWQVQLARPVGFVDLLDTVTNGVGQATRYFYRRQSDPTVYTVGTPVSYPMRNLIGGFIPLVNSVQTGNGVGGWLTTDYEYEGARADLSGRGALGFAKRRVIDRTKNITTQTTVSQAFPTIGMPTEIRATQANGTVLNLSTTSYLSLTTTAGAVCPYPNTSSKQTRDLNGALIATTTSGVNTGGIDAYCNVTDSTEAVTTSDGASFSTRTVTEYLNNTTSWLIGLPTKSTVTKTAVQPYAQANVLALVSCVSSAPSSAAATFTCILANRGVLAASGIAYTTGNNATAVGPASCAAGSSNCGNVVLTTSATAGAYAGQLRATPASSGNPAIANYALTVAPPSALSLNQCVSSTPSSSPATFTCRLSNNGSTPVTSITYTAGSNAVASGPSSCAANTVNCGNAVVTTSAAAGTYSGMLTAAPGGGGANATAPYSLTVNAGPVLALAACSSSAPSTAAASMSCTLANTGQVTATSISYTAGAGASASGPPSCAAGSSNCGTVTVTTLSAANAYSGTLTATPTPSGTVATANYSLTVYRPPTLTLSGCSSSVPSSAAATMSCTLGNTGQVAATGITYGAGSNASAVGPSSCAAGSADCGTATVTTSSAPGTYSGSMTASPGNGGNGASASYSLTVSSAPTLVLTSCSSSPASTSAATMTCTLANNGQTAASAVTYATGSNTTVTAGPASCSAGNANCGSVTVKTSTTAGTYNGSLTATPTPAGTMASAGYSLTVLTLPALSLNGCTSTTPSTAIQAITCTLANNGQTSTSVTYQSSRTDTAITGPSTCAASTSNCGTVQLSTFSPARVYAGTLTATPGSGGTGATVNYSLTVLTPPALSLMGCTSTTPSTAIQAFTCTLANNGQTSTSVSYQSSRTDTAITGPSTCGASSSNCGSVQLTTFSTPGGYAGTLTVNALSGGTGTQTDYFLRVYSDGTTLTSTPMSLDWGTLMSGSPTKSMTIQNTGLAPTTLSWSLTYTSGSIGMGNYSVVPEQSTCTSGQAFAIGQICTVTWAMNTQCGAKGLRNALLKINGGTSQLTISMTANVQRNTICQ